MKYNPRGVGPAAERVAGRRGAEGRHAARVADELGLLLWEEIPKYWNIAKKLIPGGNMILSKRPQMMLPDHWPVYYKQTKGCKIRDIDGNEFIDHQ